MLSLVAHGRKMDLNLPRVMGVVNCTDDSFYEGSRSLEKTKLEEKIYEMHSQGADIIDIGGRSSRPGSRHLDDQEELDRVAHSIEFVKANFPEQWCSIDTTSAVVAEFALSKGVEIVNDISAGTMDARLWSIVAQWKVPYVCMHMQGTPDTMQIDPRYFDVVEEIASFFKTKISLLHAAGIEQVILDPGFGFGKTISHNYQLMQGLSRFQQLNCPVLVGVSRKSMIYKLLEISPEQALNGTTVLHTYALVQGARLLRVHDVGEAKEVVRLIQAITA